jgi:hypothetical protein
VILLEEEDEKNVGVKVKPLIGEGLSITDVKDVQILKTSKQKGWGSGVDKKMLAKS